LEEGNNSPGNKKREENNSEGDGMSQEQVQLEE
jgi:hypothetical protein